MKFFSSSTCFARHIEYFDSFYKLISKANYWNYTENESVFHWLTRNLRPRRFQKMSLLVMHTLFAHTTCACNEFSSPMFISDAECLKCIFITLLFSSFGSTFVCGIYTLQPMLFFFVYIDIHFDRGHQRFFTRTLSRA